MALVPMQHSSYRHCVAYLNRVGDYADCLGQKLAKGEALLTRDNENLAVICEQLQNICAEMARMERAVADGDIIFTAAQDSWWQATRAALSGPSRAATSSVFVNATAEGYFSRAFEPLKELQPLVYQGKYSGHMLQSPAQGLSGLRRASAEQALFAAHGFLAAAGYSDLTLSAQEEIASAIPLYNFHFTDSSADSLYVAVTQSGGKIIFFMSGHDPGQAAVTAETAIAGAERLLAVSGFSGMELISRQSLGNELWLKYARRQGDVLCYPDAVEMKVALDSGQLTALDSRAYWMNSRQRSLPLSLSTAEAALESLGGEAQVSGTALAFISDNAGGETLCHEIRHTVGGEEYLTYIGVEGLNEEQILRRFTAEDGCFYSR
jgi:germination protein YpeB